MAGKGRAPRKTTQQQLDIINEQINKVQVHLNKLLQQKKALEEKHAEEQLLAIRNILNTNKLSIDELNDVIQNYVLTKSNVKEENVA